MTGLVVPPTYELDLLEAVAPEDHVGGGAVLCGAHAQSQYTLAS